MLPTIHCNAAKEALITNSLCDKIWYLLNKSEVWCSRCILLTLGGSGGPPPGTFRKLAPLSCNLGAFCGSFDNIFKGYFLYGLCE